MCMFVRPTFAVERHTEQEHQSCNKSYFNSLMNLYLINLLIAFSVAR